MTKMFMMTVLCLAPLGASAEVIAPLAQLEGIAGSVTIGSMEAVVESGNLWAAGAKTHASLSSVAPAVSNSAVAAGVNTKAIKTGNLTAGLKTPALKAPVPAPALKRKSGAGSAMGFAGGFLAVESIALGVAEIPLIGKIAAPLVFVALLPLALLIGGLGALFGSFF